MARQVPSSVVTEKVFSSVLQSAKEIQNSINIRAYYTADPDLTNFPSEDPDRTRQLSSGLTKKILTLRNSALFQHAIERLQSSKEPLNKTDQNLLNRLNKISDKADILNQSGNVYDVASQFTFKSKKFAEQQVRTVLLNKQRGGSIVFEAMDRGAKSVAEIEQYAVEKHGFKRGNLPTQEYIQRALDSKSSIKEFLSKDTNLRKEMTGAILDADKVLKAEGGGGGSTNKTISAGLLGLGIGRAGEFGATVGRSGVLETAGFIKNTIGNGYDYGSPYANVIQQQSNIRQSTIGLVASAVGAGIGSLGGLPGMYIGGVIGNQVGNIASAIGGTKDTLQAQEIGEYNQQAMQMQILFNTRPDMQRIMGKFGNYKLEPGIKNALDVMTMTRLMVAKGAVSVNHNLDEKFISDTADEAGASLMSYAQSETYGYNKAIISRYPGGSKLDLGGMSRNANVDVGDFAQRTLEYVPFTHGNIQSASDMAQRSFSQSNSFTQRQLEYGSEGYISKYTRNMLDTSIFKMSYNELISGSKAGNAKLREIEKIASNKKDPRSLMYGAVSDMSGFNPSNTPYIGAESASTTTLFPLKLTNSQKSANVQLSEARVASFHGQPPDSNANNKNLADFEKGLSGINVQLRDTTDTLKDFATATYNAYNWATPHIYTIPVTNGTKSK